MIGNCGCSQSRRKASTRSEEHTSELQSQSNLVCRLLLEKKKKTRVPPVVRDNLRSELLSRTRSDDAASPFATLPSPSPASLPSALRLRRSNRSSRDPLLL